MNTTKKTHVTFVTLGIRESEFGGGSPDAFLRLEDGKVVSVEYEQDYEYLNYVWCEGEGWADSCLGMSLADVQLFANEYFSRFFDDYRQPFVVVIEHS